MCHPLLSLLLQPSWVGTEPSRPSRPSIPRSSLRAASRPNRATSSRKQAFCNFSTTPLALSKTSRVCSPRTTPGPKSREPRFMRQGHCAERHYPDGLGSKGETGPGDGDIETSILANLGRLESSFGDAVSAGLPISVIATINSTQWNDVSAQHCLYCCVKSANSIFVPPSLETRLRLRTWHP
ncbi:hypothetical protein B0T13DRAFT_232033 [Neurospora crassa]|nr:hypothetical protein B0T13DRAFT_232033 [Neurospora crassa]